MVAKVSVWLKTLNILAAKLRGFTVVHTGLEISMATMQILTRYQQQYRCGTLFSPILSNTTHDIIVMVVGGAGS